MPILALGADNVAGKLAGAVVRRISVAESSTSFTVDSATVVELASAVVVDVGFSVSESITISFSVEDEPIEGTIFVTELVATVVLVVVTF